MLLLLGVTQRDYEGEALKVAFRVEDLPEVVVISEVRRWGTCGRACL